MNIGNSKVITSLNNQYDELIDDYINWPSFLKNFFNIIKLSQIITDNNCRQFQSITKKKYEELIDWIQMTCSSTNQYDDIIQSFFGHIDKRCNIKFLPIRIHIIDSINLTSVSLLRYYPIKSGENLLTFEDIFIDIVPIRYIDKVELIIHGIRPPLNTPLLFIAINCIYIDGFIHIVLNNKY
ncbi:uncharacterized protein CMU_016470 [Cryptosporidium muris RN66]|uniref:Autophagy protein ATG5 UblB domain-containing protein n=1 Tax=Cryptosporidium muris (strain RN66) TaxID=441375 RepID=B6ACP4_CRYMR|nr:uncharacterized protein CMU_016470 [Cryptosporidium muris RN66]EEA05898.1 hypothetical protein CMU_016470 [Cryptosporidium muris RN66]|eukprot:XP_002140247.1 hypothetical protein [Cryptosporidium muris RN66]